VGIDYLIFEYLKCMSGKKIKFIDNNSFVIICIAIVCFIYIFVNGLIVPKCSSPAPKNSTCEEYATYRTQNCKYIFKLRQIDYNKELNECKEFRQSNTPCIDLGDELFCGEIIPKYSN